MRKDKKKSKIIFYIIGIIAVVAFLIPFYILIVNSFKTQKGIFSGVFTLPGEYFTLGNYAEAFKKLDFLKSFFNSMMITVISTTIIVVFSSGAAWMLVRTKSKLSSFIFLMFAASMLIPFQSVMLPLISLMGKMNALNPPGLMFAYLGFGSSLSVILYHGFIKGIPVELEEAATIDGCNKLQIFYYIIVPLLKPITVTVSILNVMWIWNDFLLPQLTINSPGTKTIPLKMYYFFGQFSKRWDLAMAGLILAIIPVIVFYFIAQKHIIKGITQGSIK